MKTLKFLTLTSVIILVLCTIFLCIYRLNGKSHNRMEQTEVVFWSLQMGTFDGYIKPIIAEFEKQNPDLKIKWIDVPYAEGEKRTLASILSSTPPDLVNLTPDFSSVLAQKQALEYIDCQKLNVYNSQIIDLLKINGKCYAVPFYATSSLTFYNKKLTTKAGLLQLPQKYDDLFKLAKQVKVKTGAFITMPTLTENDTLLKILTKYNITTSSDLATEESRQIFDGYKFLYENDFIPKESITQNHQEALEKYMSGQLAFIQSGANFLNIIKENAPQVYKYTDVTHQFTGNTGKYDVSVMNLIIPVRAKHKDGALRFAMFLTNKQNQIELAKLTTVLPVNSAALNDDYFAKYDNSDTISKARYLSAKQLQNLQRQVRFNKNNKEIINLLNIAVQQILLGADTKNMLFKTSKEWARLEQ